MEYFKPTKLILKWEFLSMKGGLTIVLSFLAFDYPLSLSLEGAPAIVFYFSVYSLIGWLLENCYSKLTGRGFFKPNFFLGPFKPMYGVAPLLLVYFISPDMNWLVVILLCFFIPTFVEYVSGVLLQKLFQRQWWDYADMPLQIHGHICLPFSLCWILLSLICLNWVHPLIVLVYGRIEFLLAWVWPAIVLYFIAELVLAVRRHSTQVFAADTIQ